jgi:Distinct helicase family with a unique C-terminal domain including a metal-binding cysteine cluster
MLDILKLNPDQAGCVDAVLATNMLSVGVDIPRLGLMLVYGQPKSISEYIQATSRVGRGEEPGLIIVVLNNAKNRDRSHFESFMSWHATLYRDVEATSVTPFASRARDRALGTVLVTLVRHLVDGMLEKPVLSDSSIEMSKNIIEYITTRASEIDPEEKRVKKELIKLLEDWETRSPKYYWAPGVHKKHSLLQDAETVAALKAVKVSCGQAWPAMNNMRSVEPSVRYAMVNKLRRFEDD